MKKIFSVILAVFLCFVPLRVSASDFVYPEFWSQYYDYVFPSSWANREFPNIHSRIFSDYPNAIIICDVYASGLRTYFLRSSEDSVSNISSSGIYGSGLCFYGLTTNGNNFSILNQTFFSEKFYDFRSYDFLSSFIPSYSDDSNYYPLNIDQLDFFNWLKADNQITSISRLQQITALNDYIDFSTADWRIKFGIAYFNNYGGNYSAYINNYDKLTELMGSYINFDNTIDIMQREYTAWNDAYQRYLSDKRLNNFPVPSTTINNNTYNTNITDTPDDSVDISILREITRLIGVSVNNQVVLNDNNWNMLNVINNNILGLVNVMNGISAKLNVLADISVKLDDISVNLTALSDISAILSDISANLNVLVDISANLNLLADISAKLDVLADISANLNVLTDISNNLDVLVAPVVSMGDTLNDIALDIVSIRDNSHGSGSGCNYDESFWELMLIPTFNDFDEIQSDFIDKFPIMNEIATISYIDGNTVIENQLPDKELDGILADGLVPVAYANSDINIPLPDESQNEYGFQYSESDITSKDLFTFTMPTGTNDWTSSFNGMTIPLINFKRFGNAIKYFKGIVSVLALFNFTKWLLQFVPKIATGASTSD